jgi:Tfp pilus assembly protein FimT
LLITMVIMVAIAGIAVPQFSRSLTHVQLRKSTQEISALLRDARNTAISESRTIELVLEIDDQSLQIEGQEHVYRWPDAVNVELAGNATLVLQENASIRFYPDGTATNTALTISARDRRFSIAVDWLTGRVRVL